MYYFTCCLFSSVSCIFSSFFSALRHPSLNSCQANNVPAQWWHSFNGNVSLSDICEINNDWIMYHHQDTRCLKIALWQSSTVHTCIGKYLSILLGKSCSAPSPSKMGIRLSHVLAHVLQKWTHARISFVSCLWSVVSSTFSPEYRSPWSCDTRKKSSSVSDSLRSRCVTILFTVSISMASSPEDSNIVGFLGSMPTKTTTTCPARDQCDDTSSGPEIRSLRDFGRNALTSVSFRKQMLRILDAPTMFDASFCLFHQHLQSPLTVFQGILRVDLWL